MNTKDTLRSAADAIREIKRHLYFGEMVRSLRMCEAISQAAMARKIGISRQYLCNIESGEKTCPIAIAVKLANELGHPVDFFLSRLMEDQLYMEGLNYKVELHGAA